MNSLSANASSGSSSLPSPSHYALAPSQTSFESLTTSRFALVEAVDPTAAELAAALRAFEHQIDNTMIAGDRLSTAAINARFARRLSATVGHSFLEEIGQAKAAIVGARGHTVKGHRLMEAIARRVGVESTLIYGDEQKDPSDTKGK